MTQSVAESILTGLSAYFGVGLVVALLLLAGGLKRVDLLAAEAPLRVKLLLVPGITALWPIMLAKLVLGQGARPQ